MDHRDAAAEFGNLPQGWEFDSMRMMLVYTNEDVDCPEHGDDCDFATCEHWKPEVIELPAAYEVCGTCDGKGTHVNPSIDAHGLTSEDFADDPDFREEYMSGRYDVQCYGCKGHRVTPRLHERATEEQKKRWNGVLRDEAAYRRERAAEIRYGY